MQERSRSPAPPSPRLSVVEPAASKQEAGSFVAATDGVRCPHCNKKLGKYLKGTYETACPRCKQAVSITR